MSVFGAPVRVGQVWESCDPRDGGAQATVEAIVGQKVWLRRVRRAHISESTLRARYKLVREAAE